MTEGADQYEWMSCWSALCVSAMAPTRRIAVPRPKTYPPSEKRPYLRARAERHLRGWRQEDVARRTGIPQANVSAIETGRLNPTRDELERLAEAFLISPPEVLLKPCSIADPEPDGEV